MGARCWSLGMRSGAAYPRRESLRIAGVLCLAFVVRLVYNLTAAARYRPTFDAALYDHIARNLLTRHCYCLFDTHQTVSRAPLWPWIISALYALAGQHDLYARLFLCALGSGTCLIVYRFARDLFGARAALIAGVVAALYTGLFLYDGWLYTESVYTFLVIGFTYALHRLQSAPPSPGADTQRAAPGIWGRIWHPVRRSRWAITGGLFAGAASLTRPNGLIMLGVLFAWAVTLIWLGMRPWREVLRRALLIAGLAVALVAPWTLRNYLVAHAFIPIETGLGEVMIGSYNDQVAFGALPARGFWRPPPGTLNHDNLRYTPATDGEYTIRALVWMRSHPSAVPYLWALHLAHMWWPYTLSHGLPIEQAPDRTSSYAVWVLIFAGSIPIFVLAATGLVTTWRTRRRDLVPVYLMLVAAVGQNVAFYSTMRFRAPIEPLLVLLAAAFLAGALPRPGAAALRRPAPAMEGQRRAPGVSAGRAVVPRGRADFARLPTPT